MATRVDLVHRLAALVGPHSLRVTDAGSGWPARAEVNLDGTWVEIDLFVGPIGLSQRNRDDVERRFQNPGQDRPITLTRGRTPLLLGIWEQDRLVPVPRPVIVLADAARRAGHMTRFSVFESLGALVEASATGWVAHASESGEIMHYVFPALLPLAVTARAGETPVADDLIQAVVLGSGLADGDGRDLDAAERSRRASGAIVRDARFSRRVVRAYAGLCAMCGFDVGLVQGAHIYPAAAPGSPDEPWNGLALCPTHHAAFDRHLVGVNPADGSIHYSKELSSQHSTSPAVASLIGSTYEFLATPADEALRPRRDMFERRYRHFEGRYGWLESA